MLRELVAWLATAAATAPPLGVVNVVFHQFEDGPPLPASFAYAPGDSVFLSFQVAGLRAMGEDQVVQLSYTLSAMDPAGVPLVAPKNGKLRAELAPQDKDWMPKVRWEFPLPPWAPSGAFRVSIQVKDLNTGQEMTKEFTFAVRGRDVAPSETLVVRNFRFLRSEEDGEPLHPPAYRPGSAVWARFDVTGFKLGPKNQFQVEYDVAVLSPAGKQIYSQPNAAVEKDESFYPRRYVPGILSLNLTPTVKPGEYTIVLTLRDGVGGQQAESRHTFLVE
jgi:hypothetical protein